MFTIVTYYYYNVKNSGLNNDIIIIKMEQYIKHNIIETAALHAFPIIKSNTSVSYTLDTITVDLLTTYHSYLVTNVWIASTPIMLQGVKTPAKHVYLIFEVNNTKLIMEKHERTELSIYKVRPNEESIQLSLSLFDLYFRRQTLSEWIENGIMFYRIEKGGRQRPVGDTLLLFWSKYHVTQNNCQQFVWSMLLANQFPHELMNNEPFIQFNQKAEEISIRAKEHVDKVSKEQGYHPLFQALSNSITNAFMDYVSQVTTTLAQAENKTVRDSAYAMTANGKTITYYDSSMSVEDICIIEENTFFTKDNKNLIQTNNIIMHKKVNTYYDSSMSTENICIIEENPTVLNNKNQNQTNNIIMHKK
jgi:hypothetical protein